MSPAKNRESHARGRAPAWDRPMYSRPSGPGAESGGGGARRGRLRSEVSRSGRRRGPAWRAGVAALDRLEDRARARPAAVFAS